MTFLIFVSFFFTGAAPDTWAPGWLTLYWSGDFIPNFFFLDEVVLLTVASVFPTASSDALGSV